MPVAGNVESHELKEFLDLVERYRKGLDRLETLLLLAVKNKASAWIVSTLINIGADLDARGEYERTPLHLAAQHSTSPDIVKVLVEGGADVDARETDQQTPLHLAALYNRSMVATLIAHKANIHLVDKYGCSVLTSASGCRV